MLTLISSDDQTPCFPTSVEIGSPCWSGEGRELLETKGVPVAGGISLSHCPELDLPQLAPTVVVNLGNE